MAHPVHQERSVFIYTFELWDRGLLEIVELWNRGLEMSLIIMRIACDSPTLPVLNCLHNT